MNKSQKISRKTIAFSVLLLFITLACQAAQRAFASPTPMIEPVAASSTPFPTFTPMPTLQSFTATATIDPALQPINCEDDSCLDECLKRIEQSVDIGSFDSLRSSHSGRDSDFTLVVYDVNDGAIGDPQFVNVSEKYKKYQEDVAAQKQIWNYASSLLPPQYLKWVHQFYVYTDGTDNSLAWVEAEGDQWILAIDILDSENPIDLTESLIHEYGHLITLNSEQVKKVDDVFAIGWEQNSELCPQFIMPDGCSTSDSYINLFYEKYWKGIFNEWYTNVETKTANSMEEYQRYVTKFYDNHPDEFVRTYAATNIAEDMAESFMNFILRPKTSESTIVAQKTLFYYDFPELVALRKQTIQNMCSYTQK